MKKMENRKPEIRNTKLVNALRSIQPFFISGFLFPVFHFFSLS